MSRPLFPAGRAAQVLLVLLIAIPLVLLALIVQTQPRVPLYEEVSAAERRQIEQLIVDNSPDRFRSSGERVVSFSAEELNLLAAFGTRNIAQLSDVGARFRIQDSTAFVDLTMPWLSPSLSLYLNMQLELGAQGESLELRNLKAGHLTLPTLAVGILGRRLQRRLEEMAIDYQEVADLQQSIRHIELQGDLVDIHLEWEPRLLSKLRAQAQQFFISPEDRDRILAYYAEIARIVDELPESTSGPSLQIFMTGLFEYARVRSAAGSDPVAENRTLLQALALFVNHLQIEQLVTEVPEAWPHRPRRLYVTLRNRSDLSQHFVSSAAISASAGAGVAEVLSNSKEIYDARHRSGFDFSDMTANLAGMALGEAATRDPDSARQIQDKLAQGAEEAAYMPSIPAQTGGLPEEEMQRIYNNRDNETYRQRLREIEEQVSLLPLYR